MNYESYRAKVYGISWEGLRAFTIYCFDKQPTHSEIIAVAVDFRKVTRVQVTKRTVAIERVGCRRV